MPVTGQGVLSVVINGALFNVSWLAIVMTESAIIAPLVAIVHLLIHFILMGKGYIEVKIIAQVAVIGVIVDQLLFYFGVFVVDGKAALPPLWLSCLWPVLATTLMHAFSSLQSRYALAAVLGGIGGTASFIAGTRLTSVAFESALFGPIIIGIVWAFLFPLLLQLPRLNNVE